MKTKDFDFELPDTLIAQHPLPNRTDSRLLHYVRATQQITHTHFKSLVDHLNPGDLLVMNNTEVIPARLYGTKETGGKVELLIERVLSEKAVLTHIKASKAPKPGSKILLNNTWELIVLDKEDDLYHCKLQTAGTIHNMLNAIGHIPLPPYITREDKQTDFERYQTVYAKHKGSVAAPTAGLHFDETLLKQLREKGVQVAYVTLHVGAGTFQPVRTDNLIEHKMHTEYFEISQDTCDTILRAKAQGGRIIAVGTTSLRSLESAAQKGPLKPQSMDTDIFIYPGYTFKLCDGLITNFHLPQSTLLMLVAAFIGHQETMTLYKEAVAEKYRFFSYGDATLLL